MLNKNVVCGMGSCSCCGHVENARSKEKREWVKELGSDMIECFCRGCSKDSLDVEILQNGYCEECFGQGCDCGEPKH